MIQLTGAHLAAVGRRRRIIDQMDGMTPIDLLGIPMQDYVDLRFHHADLEGSQIDGFIWDVGDGEDAYSLYPTEALPLLDDPGLNRWRDQGVDFVGTLVEETRRRGLEVFWNSRVAPVDPAQPSLGQPLTDPARRNWLKEQHPDWVQRCWWWNGLYDLSSPGLREHKVAVLRDLLAHYAFDGLQLDFSRHQPTLPIGRQWQHREDATAYVRGVREMTLAMEAQTGRPILLAVKVPETVAGCAIDGLDVATWARELLVDIFVIGSRTLTVDVAGFRGIAAGTPIRIAATHDAHHSTDGYCSPSLEVFLGAFSNFWAQGADFVTVFNWPTAPEEHYTRLGSNGDVMSGTYGQHTEAMFLVGEPNAMVGRDATYVVERRGGFPWTDEGCFYCCNHDRPLPAELPNHGQAVHLPLHIWREVQDIRDVQADAVAEARLRVILWAADHGDRIQVWLGGTRLRELARDATVKDPQIYGGGPQPSAGSIPSYVEDPDQRLLQVTFELPARDLIAGENRISIAAGERAPYRPAMYGNGIVVEKVEADIRYHRDTAA